ncbi:MAG: PLP-dependent aminotransferase family protein [Paracoccaceae bacterium]
MEIGKETFFLDPAFRGTLQTQIQQIIASAILAGRIEPGDKLPSSRKLAAHLGIARITVTLAYNELVADDYLRAASRSGYFVSTTAPVTRLESLAPPEQRDTVDWNRFFSQRFTGGRLVEKHDNWRSYPFPFIYGQADPALFHHSNWRLCAHQALGRREFDSLTTDYVEGDDPELLEFIARHSLPRRGIRARPEQIMVTVGAQNALWILSRILLGKGRLAAFENPGYPGLRNILRHMGAATVPVPVDDDGLPPDLLPTGLDAVFVTPSHQCPTTVTMPMERRHEVLRLAHERDFLVIEDDYEFEMSFLNPPTPALKSLDEDGRVIYVGSFSKSLFPGLRLGYLVGSETFIRQARALRHAMLRHPPGNIQRTTAYFMARGHYDAMVRQMRDAFFKRRRVMAAAIENSPLRVAGSASFGGSSFWVETPLGIDTEKLAGTLMEDGVLIEPGSPFFTGPDAPSNFCRLAYSSIAHDRIPEGVERISAHVRANAVC